MRKEIGVTNVINDSQLNICGTNIPLADTSGTPWGLGLVYSSTDPYEVKE